MEKKYHTQYGGNPIIASLPAITDIVIPAGLTLASHLAHKYFYPEEKSKQLKSIGQQSASQGGGGDNHPQTKSSLPIFDDPILKAYLKQHHLSKVKPEILIPLGILLAVFSSYRHLK